MSTPVTLPSSVPFPVTITAIECSEGQAVPKHEPIFRYKYWEYQDDPNSKDEVPPKIRVERIGTFESPIEGEIQHINISVHEEIAHSGVELCSIKEACTHTVQYGGLCALCGKAVEDEKDYSGYSFEDRATISMSHDNTGLKISLDEAAKIEQSTTDRLASEKKLILVVDLDQTVIHATVDPTVGEWQSDPSNPNYPAIRDVKTFCLEEEAITPPGWTGPRLAPTKCWYYVKVRPGLSDFLEQISKLYEMHIYTMATRNYALAIAKIIDPTAKYFGDRILSRDESGSLTHKNLKRLFPVDQSMVAIIDDRGDIWQWESNLIKVVPYDFFVGIGDINSSFLPKKNGQLTGPTKKRKSIARLEAQQTAELEGGSEATFEEEEEKVLSELEAEPASPVDRILELGGGEGNTNLLIEQSITRNQSIEQQQIDRPLAKLQHNLEKMHHHGTDSDGQSRSNSPDGSSGEEEEEEDEDEDDNLLYDDDNELIALNKVLVNIHDHYYKILKENQAKNSAMKPDLTRIIPHLKSTALQGITILFSGIIPLGINFENADIVIWCKQFGVKVVNEVYPNVTHVVCRDPANGQGPTFKARVARKILPDAKIVNPDWLFACLSGWKKVDEKEYLIPLSDEKQWVVGEKDVEKYCKALERQKEKEANRALSRPRFGSIDSIEEYDLDEANQEVDDFLAGISDDDDDEDDELESTAVDNFRNGHNYDDDDDEEDADSAVNNTNSFIKDLYQNPKKRKLEDDLEDDEDSEDIEEKEETIEEQAQDQNGNGSAYLNKKQKGAKVEDIDELEKELLDGFDDLEED
ncbi:uncharacterized protein RJT20DRAFT_22493 [Scheffersomyces xylosifermentans]|uniref:uncharacterized protein n=1 Tax=Scheffersomyces xylosifermentans TaxID=1304137 RepID=UPI00315DF167